MARGKLFMKLIGIGKNFRIKQKSNQDFQFPYFVFRAEDVDGSYSAVAMLVDCSSRILPKPKEEQKMLLLWFKIFEIMMQLHEHGIR